jgi:hypothetical protein
MIMMVAVAPLPDSESPLQHSPMLGHFASSQTVASPNSRTVFRSSKYLSDVAGCALSHFGLGNILDERGGAFFLFTTESGTVIAWTDAKCNTVESSSTSFARKASRREGEDDLPSDAPLDLSIALLVSVTTGLAAVDNSRRVVAPFRTMLLVGKEENNNCVLDKLHIATTRRASLSNSCLVLTCKETAERRTIQENNNFKLSRDMFSRTHCTVAIGLLRLPCLRDRLLRFTLVTNIYRLLAWLIGNGSMMNAASSN